MLPPEPIEWLSYLMRPFLPIRLTPLWRELPQPEGELHVAGPTNWS